MVRYRSISAGLEAFRTPGETVALARHVSRVNRRSGPHVIVWLTPTPWIIADFVDSDAVSMGLRKG
ncbi:hypothetical protein JOE26_001142 [Rhodococcus coprophilus]|uniref:Uncharacterized protein n=1 Tax=Rhodococcus coprophilus TaxID=38310 RepID=A0A2X4U1R2_9NOCA|nr:hypothetical protein [Rhodococcus coprophilus]SQI32539.1 Uncharacterised protein [Rhodococcus coprophilus]